MEKNRHSFLTAFSVLSLVATSSYAQGIGKKPNSFVDDEIKPIFQAVAVATFIIGFLFVIAYIFFAESRRSKKVIQNIIIVCALSAILVWVRGIL
jgi:hypothetical protein